MGIIESAKAARIWVSSEEGKLRIQQILERAKQSRKRLKKARKLNFARLHRPMDF